MASIALYASDSISSSGYMPSDSILPSPTSIKKSYEQIWDENAGRNSNGTMIATFVASKLTYDVTWGIMDATEFAWLKDYLHTGFFYFGESASRDTPPRNPSKYYRSEITAEIVYAGGHHYYKDVSVQVIEK